MADAARILAAALLLLLLPSSVKAKYYIYSGEYLYAGAYLENGSYKFIMQEDCNLVLYDNNRAVWSSNTGGRGRGCYLAMQTDGNLVVYTPQKTPIWASNTGVSGQAIYVLILQDDRNVVIYGGGSRWATGTYTRIGVVGVDENPTSVVVTQNAVAK